MEASWIKISTIAKVILLRDSVTIEEKGNLILVNSFYQPGEDSFQVNDYLKKGHNCDIAIVLDNTIDSFFFSLLMNGFIFRSTIKEDGVHDIPRKITLKSIKDCHIPVRALSQQIQLGYVERLIEFLMSKPEYFPPLSLIDDLRDLRDSVCLELYMSGFFNQLGVSVIDEIILVTEDNLDFSKQEVILNLINNLAGPESTVRMKVREMNVVMSHYFKNLEDILKRNDLENK